MAETNSFKELELAGWRQFQSVDIEFHEHLTVITGTNGAGKSTLLNLLTPHLGVSRPILSNPFRRKGQTLYSSGLFNFPKMFDWVRGARQPQAMQVIGRLTYANGAKSVIEIPANTGIQYNPSLRDAQSVRGFHFPSHRLLPNYRSIPNIPFAGMNPEHAFGSLIGESNQSYLGNNTASSMMFQLKNIIAAWAAIGEGNRTLEADPAQYAAFEGLNKSCEWSSRKRSDSAT